MTTSTWRVGSWAAGVSLALTSAGCALAHERAGIGPITDGDTGSPTTSIDASIDMALPPPDTSTQPVRDVDLLLLVDDSSGMSPRQQRLAAMLVGLIPALTTGTRADGSTFTRVRSLHLGIVSTDMGIGPITGVPSCNPGFGDDGILLTAAVHPTMGCTGDYRPTYPDAVFSLDRTSSPEQLAADVGCVARLGTRGCGLEFPLESVLKALAPPPDVNGASSVAWTRPDYRPPIFAGNTFGHGTDPATNGAFLRPDSLLVIVLLTDEDDGSSANYEIFSPTDPAFSAVELNVRATVFADQLFPVERYVDGLIGLRADPRNLAFVAITGVPLDAPSRGLVDVLSDPRMLPQVDGAQRDRLVPVCNDESGPGVAVPAVRLTRLAIGLARAGAASAVHSICHDDYAGAADAILDAVIARGSGR
jgi:hypothetical protein